VKTAPGAELILLGTGTCIPVKDRSSSAYVLRYQDFHLLLDIGTGTLRRLTEAGVDYRDIAAIAISHFHPDHISDLVPLLFALKHTPQYRRHEPLEILGPPGLISVLRRFADVYGCWVSYPGYPLTLLEVEEETASVGPVQIRTIRARHSRRAISMRITLPDGVSVCYSGDTGFSKELIGLAEDTDFLLLECSYPSSMPMNSHLTPEEAGKIAAASRCKCLILTHFYPLFQSEDPMKTAKKFFPGEIILGTDLAVIPLNS